MSEEYQMGKLGVICPFKAKEGTITITDGATAHGNLRVPVLSAGLKKGDLVELDSEMTIKKLSSGVPIGEVYNTPKWTNVEPSSDYTQAQAVTAGLLREVGIETIFKKIETRPAKSGAGITAGKYLVLKAEMELSASSGSTATNCIALSAQDSNNRVVVGFI